MSTKSWFKFAILGLIWGSSFMWIKIAIQEVGPFTLVTFRVLFASLALITFILTQKPSFPRSPAILVVFAVLGLTNVAVPFVLISWSEQHISSGLAAILNSTVPLFGIVIGPLFLSEERFTSQKLGGLLIGFLGVIVLMSNQLGSGLDLHTIGILTMLAAAISYACAGIYARIKTKGLTADVQALGQMASAFVFILPSALVVEAPFKFPHLPLTWLALVWLGVLGSGVATLLYYSLLHEIGPTRTLLVSYVFPLVGVILGLIFLGESLTWRLAVGGALIISGIGLVNRKNRKVALAD